MTTYSPPLSKAAVPRSTFFHATALLGAIVAIAYAGPASADSPTVDNKSAATAPGEDTMARCQQLFGLWSRHTTDGYARPLDARMALEDCQKGNVAAGVATLKRTLEREQIAIPPADGAVAQTPPATTLRPHGEKRHLSQ
jgi:hypothetical protein